MSFPVDWRKYRARVVESESVSHAWCMYVCTYHPPIHFIALTAIPVLSPVLFMPSLYYTSYNSKNFFIYYSPSFFYGTMWQSGIGVARLHDET